VIMAQHGTKGQGQSHQGKLVVARHNSKMSKRAANALEKAHETRVRQASKKLCREY
jgi:hypothetical protein